MASLETIRAKLVEIIAIADEVCNNAEDNGDYQTRNFLKNTCNQLRWHLADVTYELNIENGMPVSKAVNLIAAEMNKLTA